MAFLGNKYGYAPHLAEAAPQRVAEIVKALSDQLEQQQKCESHFFIGDRLSALDIYWAAFAALIQPLPNEFCAIPDGFRRMYTCTHPTVMAAMSPHLLAHRDFIYHEYLELPVDLKVEL